jgi:hypothetical protein
MKAFRYLPAAIVVGLTMLFGIWWGMDVYLGNREARERVRYNVDRQFLSYLRYEAGNGKLNMKSIAPGVAMPLRERLDPASAERFFAVKPGSLDDYYLIANQRWVAVYRGHAEDGGAIIDALKSASNVQSSATLQYDPTNGISSQGFRFQLIELRP